MYWYKPWRELRARMVVASLAIATGCALVVWKEEAFRNFRGESMTYERYVWKLLYDTIVRDLFVVLTIVFGCGSLRQERAQRTLGFTLALPVSRMKATLTRAWVGYGGVLAMAILPAVVLALCSPMVGQHYAPATALRFSLLYSVAGAAIYGITFLLTHSLAGEYTAALLAVPALFAYEAVISLPGLQRLRSLDIIATMTGEGMPWFDARSGLFVGPLPWASLGVLAALAAACVGLAARSVAKVDLHP